MLASVNEGHAADVLCKELQKWTFYSNTVGVYQGLSALVLVKFELDKTFLEGGRILLCIEGCLLSQLHAWLLQNHEMPVANTPLLPSFDNQKYLQALLDTHVENHWCVVLTHTLLICPWPNDPFIKQTTIQMF